MDGSVQEELVRRVRAWAGRRVRDLRVEVREERVVLLGYTETYYVKQLAQAGVREVLPEANLENAISVAEAPDRDMSKYTGEGAVAVPRSAGQPPSPFAS